MDHQPLKITFMVSGGWSPPAYPLHLDGLLAHCVTQRDIDDIQDTPTVEALRALGEALPLSRYEQDGDWVWQASAITPAHSVMNDSGFFTQRRDPLKYAMAVRDGQIQHGRYRHGSPMTENQYQIDTLRGIHRNLLGFYPVQRNFDGGLLHLQAWCIGNRDLIQEILTDDRRPTHIGARRRSGLGRIESVAIEIDELARENWKLRVRPWQMLEQDVPVQAAWKAPYWAAENRGQAFVPSFL